MILFYFLAYNASVGVGLLILSLTLPGASSDHLPPGLLSQSGRGRSSVDALFPSLGRPCGTVYHLNFGSSTLDVHFADC